MSIDYSKLPTVGLSPMVDVYTPIFDALKAYGSLLIDKETAAKKEIATQDPTDDEYVKGVRRGELLAYHNAYLEFKLMVAGLLK